MEEDGDQQADEEKEPKGCFKRFFTGKPSDAKEDHELLAQKMLRELIIYLIFLVVVCYVAFGMTSPYSYYYTKVMKDLFIHNEEAGITFGDIKSVEDFWTYVRGPFIKGLYWEKWYNKEPLGKLDGYIYYENKLLGLPRMRQVRVKADSCSVADEFKSFIDSCFGPYTPDQEDVDAFGIGLKLKATEESPWHYRDSSDIDGFWHWGEIASYEGGGYVQDLSLDRLSAEDLIKDLYKNLWIQRGTRAVFLSFTVYNANINLFCMILLVVEFPATGGAFPSWSFTTIKLIQYDNNFHWLQFFSQILFCLFIIYYLVQEALEMFFNGLDYFKQLWNAFDLLLVLSATVCIGFQLYREFVVMEYLPEILSDFSKYQDFTSLAFWESRSNNVIAVTVFLAWVKVFKYISFNKTMTQLATTLSRCAKDLMGFFIMFFIVFLAFTQLGYLLFGNQVEDFSNFSHSFFTLFRIILGDFNFSQLEKANRILGPLFFMLFVFFVFFVLINMFLAIINDTYSEVKSDMTKQTEMYIMSDYLKQSYKRFLAKIWQHKENRKIEHMSRRYTTTEKTSVKDWQEMLIEEGFEEDLVEAVMREFGLGKDHILESSEQKNILIELNRMRNLTEEHVENELETDVKGREYVASEEFDAVMRRVERMETTLIGIVGNIDAVLQKMYPK